MDQSINQYLEDNAPGTRDTAGSKVDLRPALTGQSQREEINNQVITMKQWFSKCSPRTTQELSGGLGKTVFLIIEDVICFVHFHSLTRVQWIFQQLH